MQFSGLNDRKSISKRLFLEIKRIFAHIRKTIHTGHLAALPTVSGPRYQQPGPAGNRLTTIRGRPGRHSGSIDWRKTCALASLMRGPDLLRGNLLFARPILRWRFFQTPFFVTVSADVRPIPCTSGFFNLACRNNPMADYLGGFSDAFNDCVPDVSPREFATRTVEPPDQRSTTRNNEKCLRGSVLLILDAWQTRPLLLRLCQIRQDDTCQYPIRNTPYILSLIHI